MTARTARPRPGRRTLRLAGAALAAAVLVAGCQGEPEESPTPAPPVTTEPGDEPTGPEPTDEPTAGPTTDVPVYFVVDTRAGLRLARESRETTGDEPVRAAVESMLAGPEDPDYSSTWASGTQVLGISTQDDGFTVDLSGEARTADVGSEGALRMVQQLVWTVTHAADQPDATVLLHIDGEPAGELWGVTEWSEPIGRDDALEVRLLTQVDEPAQGATVTSPVTVSGEAAAFEGTVLWQVVDGSGAEVESGFTTTAEGQTFSPFSFEIELEPGDYTVIVTESDPSDGEGGEPMSDSKEFTVS